MLLVLAATLAIQALPCACKVGDCARLDFLPKNPWICVRPERQDVHVVRAIKHNGLWERHIVRDVYAALSEDPTTLFLDVGAHIGQYTIIAASSGFPVVAFEPNPDNCAYLKSSLAVNKIAHRVALVPHPTLDTPGVLSGFRNDQTPKDNVGGWAIRPDSRGALVSTTIDSEVLKLERRDYSSIVMKIDIEGSEPQALAGAARTLKRVRAIFMEWGTGGDAKREMARNLAQMGLCVTDRDCLRTDFQSCPWDIQFSRDCARGGQYAIWIVIATCALCTGGGVFAAQSYTRSRPNTFWIVP